MVEILKLGQHTAAGKAEEEDLVIYLVKLDNQGCGLHTRNFTVLCTVTFSRMIWSINNELQMAGKDWVRGFLSRHKNLRPSLWVAEVFFHSLVLEEYQKRKSVNFVICPIYWTLSSLKFTELYHLSNLLNSVISPIYWTLSSLQFTELRHLSNLLDSIISPIYWTLSSLKFTGLYHLSNLLNSVISPIYWTLSSLQFTELCHLSNLLNSVITPIYWNLSSLQFTELCHLSNLLNSVISPIYWTTIISGISQLRSSTSTRPVCSWFTDQKMQVHSVERGMLWAKLIRKEWNYKRHCMCVCLWALHPFCCDEFSAVQWQLWNWYATWDQRCTFEEWLREMRTFFSISRSFYCS
jgi:hypothetical protein